MTHETVIAILVSCASGYAMLYGGLAKQRLRVAARGRCPNCGRQRFVCRCR